MQTKGFGACVLLIKTKSNAQKLSTPQLLTSGYCVTLGPHLLQLRLGEKFVIKFSAKQPVLKEVGLSGW